MAQNGAKKVKMIGRRKAVWSLRLQGKTEDSIAVELGVCRRTVIRDLAFLIRQATAKLGSPSPGRRASSRQSAKPYRLLGLSVVLRAIRDYRAGDPEARLWLLSAGPLWLEGCEVNFDLDKWQAWVNARCPTRQPCKPSGSPTRPQERL